MHDAIQLMACGLRDGKSELVEFGFFGIQKIKTQGKWFGAALGHDLVVYFFQFALMAACKHHSGTCSGIGLGNGGTDALRGTCDEDGFTC